MSDSKKVLKWEDNLKKTTDTEAEKCSVISNVTWGIGAVGAAVLAAALYRVGDSSHEHCSCLTFLHLAAVAANFGSTCWVTFFAGIIMLRTLPRHMFGFVQSRLFPVFFDVGMATTTISLATYLVMHPRGSWGDGEKCQIFLLTTTLIAEGATAFIISPQSIVTMWRMYQAEQQIGDGGLQVGINYPDKKQHPVFAKIHRRFGMWHGISMLVKLVGFIASGIHLWHMATRLRL